MGRREQFWNRISRAEETGLFPGVPLIEILGDRRVLIEGHQGVREYGTCRIRVAVKHGCVEIQGEGLELRFMTREQVVVLGRIRNVAVTGREAP
ncbi:MAG: YabP/YqfC family sporulation protein [Oscillospiraceae bacterium]|nr:YabP/YqfC family sporulation protein [Oscillospiraceae bacterium]